MNIQKEEDVYISIKKLTERLGILEGVCERLIKREGLRKEKIEPVFDGFKELEILEQISYWERYISQNNRNKNCRELGVFYNVRENCFDEKKFRNFLKNQE